MSDDKRPRPGIPVDPAGLEEARLVQFHVTVGHEKFVVRGADRADAVREARRRLCLELPRMWDVIQSMEDSRFVITPVDAPELPAAAAAADLSDLSLRPAPPAEES